MSKKPLNNKIIIASAGGRKTTFITEDALNKPKQNILITTYTTENVDQITSYLIEKNGCIPKNIAITSWFIFLLRECAKPYQNLLFSKMRIRSIDFKSEPNRYTAKDKESYFINSACDLYQDRVSDFICQCNTASKGLIIKRLEKIFDHIYIDEMQDLSGWDQNLIELLLDSSIKITLVGDPRQSTYSTNNSLKNKATKGKNMTKWIEELRKKEKCDVEERTECYRCNQSICDFADALYPLLPKTTSKNAEITGHDGIFCITTKEFPEYFSTYNPKILRWNRRTNTLDMAALNIGASKGRTFNRVVIFPTKNMKDYLKTKDIEKAGDISKFYVAVTRARFSVAFVL